MEATRVYQHTLDMVLYFLGNRNTTLSV